MLLTKALIAIGKLAFAIAGAREIEVVAIANGFAEGKGFQLSVIEFGVFFGSFRIHSSPLLSPLPGLQKHELK